MLQLLVFSRKTECNFSVMVHANSNCLHSFEIINLLFLAEWNCVKQCISCNVFYYVFLAGYNKNVVCLSTILIFN